MGNHRKPQEGIGESLSGFPFLVVNNSKGSEKKEVDSALLGPCRPIGRPPQGLARRRGAPRRARGALSRRESHLPPARREGEPPGRGEPRRRGRNAASRAFPGRAEGPLPARRPGVAPRR